MSLHDDMLVCNRCRGRCRRCHDYIDQNYKGQNYKAVDDAGDALNLAEGVLKRSLSSMRDLTAKHVASRAMCAATRSNAEPATSLERMASGTLHGAPAHFDRVALSVHAPAPEETPDEISSTDSHTSVGFLIWI